MPHEQRSDEHKLKRLVVLVAVALSVVRSSNSQADEKTSPIAITDLKRAEPIDYTTDIAPLLKKNCVACHHGEDGDGGVVLDTPEAIRRGASDKQLIVPGKSAESLLLRVAAHQAKPTMPPPDNKVGATALTGAQLGLLKLWIDQGANGTSKPISTELLRRQLSPSLTPILALALSPDDETLACSRGPQLQIYDIRGPRLVTELSDPSLKSLDGRPVADMDLIRSLAFDKSGHTLASGGFRAVRIWQRSQPKRLSQTDLGQPIRSAAMSPLGDLAAFGLESGVVELRSLKDQRLGEKTQTLTGHAAPVTALVWSPAGLVTGSIDKSVRLWDVKNGTSIGHWPQASEVRALATLNDASQIVVGSADGIIRIWPTAALNDATGKDALPTPAIELKGHSKAISSLAAIPQLKDRLVTGSEDGRVRIWDASNSQTVRDFNHEAPVLAIAISLDGRRLVSTGEKSARLWKLDDGQLIAEIKQDGRQAREITRADGALVYAKACVEYRKRDLREAEEALKRETGVVEGSHKAKEMAEKTVTEKTAAAEKANAARTEAEQKAEERAAALKAATDARAVAKTNAEQAAAQVKQSQTDFEQAKAAAEKNKDDKDLAAAASKAEQAFATARTNKQTADTAFAQTTETRNAAERANQDAVRAVNEARNKAQGPERELKEAKNALVGATNFIGTATAVLERAKAAVPAAQQVVTAAESLAAQREMQKQALTAAMSATQTSFRSAAFSSEGRSLALGTSTGSTLMLDAETGASLFVLDADTAPLSSIINTHDGRLLTTSGTRTSVWNTDISWRLARTIGDPKSTEQFADRVLSLDFSPDGKLLATAGGMAAQSGELQLWNMSDGSLVRRLETPHRDTIHCVRFSPDGQFLATASADKLVKIFRAETGQLQQTLAGHSQYVLGVAWTPDGKSLVSCGSDQVIKIWNLESGTATRTLRGDTYRVGEYRRAVTSLSFVGDTEHFLASAGDRTVRLHRTSNSSDVRAYLKGNAYFHAAVATKDGKWVVGGGQDGVLHFWSGEQGWHQFAIQPDLPGVAIKSK